MDIPANYDRLAELAIKKATGNLTKKEDRELTGIIESSPHMKKLFEELMDPDLAAKEIVLMSELDDEGAEATVKNISVWHYAAAASLLLAIGLVCFFVFREKKDTPPVAQTEQKSLPANTTSKEPLALISNPDGSSVTVTQAQSGTIGYMSAEQPFKMNGKVLLLPRIVFVEGVKPLVIKTLPGKDLHVQLSDGSKLLLSGSSELSFPAGFTSNKRDVALHGEAYFEVAKNGTTPFTVNVGELGIEVLGTEFNVSAYKPGGPVITSLFSGKVRLKASGGETMVLEPGEEGVLANHKFSKQPLGERSTNKVQGKKAGVFIFDNTDAKTMVEEIAASYNYDVQYNGTMPAKPCYANFSRGMDIHIVLKNLSREMGFGLYLRGKTIVVDFPKTN